MYDLHIHSQNSHDGKETLDDICLTAIQKGARGIAVTDHIDMHSYRHRNAYETVRRSIAETLAAREKYQGQLNVLCGVELGGYPYDADMGQKVLELTDYDVVIGSLHYVRKGRFEKAYAAYKYDAASIKDAEIVEFLGCYFDEVEEMVDAYRFQVLGHLTCPLRYINCIYQRGIDPLVHEDKIRRILTKIIQKGIALEVNTSGYSEKYGYVFYPDEPVLRLYRELGGELVTLGSDAHVRGNILMGFDAAQKLLKKTGFDSYCWFEKGQVKKVPIDSGKLD